MNRPKESDRRRCEREPFNTKLDLFIDTHNLPAESLDISEHGLRFRISQPIKCKIRLELDNEMAERELKLVWARKEEGKMVYGLEFTTESIGWKY